MKLLCDCVRYEQSLKLLVITSGALWPGILTLCGIVSCFSLMLLLWIVFFCHSDHSLVFTRCSFCPCSFFPWFWINNKRLIFLTLKFGLFWVCSKKRTGYAARRIIRKPLAESTANCVNGVQRLNERPNICLRERLFSKWLLANCPRGAKLVFQIFISCWLNVLTQYLMRVEAFALESETLGGIIAL